MVCLSEDELLLWVEGGLSAEQQAAAEAHARGCAACRQAHDRQRADLALFEEIKAQGLTRGEARGWDPLQGISGYELLSEVQRSGQGVVVKALQKATRRVVAVKILLHGPTATPRQRLRFEREIDLAAQLRHPHIVTIHDSGVSADRPYLVMEYIEGRRLDEYVRTNRLAVRQRLQLFRVVCAAVGYAHQRGVIHRDLKPGNVLVDREGEPHVLDFGLAKSMEPAATDDAGQLTETGEFLGTLAYAAPEQARGEPSQIDTRTDVYALGLMLYGARAGPRCGALFGGAGDRRPARQRDVLVGQSAAAASHCGGDRDGLSGGARGGAGRLVDVLAPSRRGSRQGPICRRPRAPGPRRRATPARGSGMAGVRRECRGSQRGARSPRRGGRQASARRGVPPAAQLGVGLASSPAGRQPAHAGGPRVVRRSRGLQPRRHAARLSLLGQERPPLGPE